MGEALKRRLQQARFEHPVQEALLNLLVAAGHVRERMDRLVAGHDITPGQYNVLRILKGAHPRGYARCEIARRMVERAPDLTRMIDRLQKRGLVERGRSDGDRRQSITRITRKGMELVDALRPTVAVLHRELGARLTRRESAELSRLLEKVYG